MGGRTKTSIIATISPATINVEETLSTLDYAYRARNITNRPEVNQKLSKREVLKEYSDEMERLKKDLLNLRDKNGVYLAKENYHQMLEQIEKNQKDITSMVQEIGVLKEEMEKKVKLFLDVEKRMIEKSRELTRTTDALHQKEMILSEKQAQLKLTVKERDEQQHLVSKHVATEVKLGQQARKLIVVNDEVDDDLDKLHNKLGKLTAIKDDNRGEKESFLGRLEEVSKELLSSVAKWGSEIQLNCQGLEAALRKELDSRINALEDLAKYTNELVLAQRNINSDMKNASSEYVCNEIQNDEKFKSLLSAHAEEGVSFSVCYKDAMLSHLKLLSEKLSDQSRAVNTITKSAGEDMEGLKKKVILTSNKIVDCMKEMDTSVKAYHSSVDQSSNLLRESNKERLASHANLKASLLAFMDMYNSHQEVNIDVDEKNKEIVKEMESQVTTLTKEVKESTGKVHTVAKDVLQLEQEDVGLMVKNFEKCINTCEHLNEGLDRCRKDAETCSADFEKKVTSAMEETVKHVTNVFDIRNTHLEEMKKCSNNQRANFVKELGPEEHDN